VIAIWLMLTPWVFNIDSGIASVNHMVGALALTVIVTAFATVARAFRFLNVILGTVLLFTPFFYDTGLLLFANSILCGLALVVFALPRGPVTQSYGSWDRFIF
jgi:hypothetical protein